MKPEHPTIECPGSYMGNHTHLRIVKGKQVADCRYCNRTMRTIDQGRHLHTHRTVITGREE